MYKIKIPREFFSIICIISFYIAMSGEIEKHLTLLSIGFFITIFCLTMTLSDNKFIL